MPEKDRPVLEIPFSSLEKLLQGISAVLLAAMLACVFLTWNRIPQKIPSHFGASGKVDAWGNKGALLFVPAVILVIYILITVLERFPHIFNYPFEITEQNAGFQYHNARTAILWIKAEVVIMFCYIELISIEVAFGNARGLGIAFLPVFLIVIFGTLAFYIRRMLKCK